MLNICKFQEYLGNSRKIISRNKEFKLWHLQNFIKEKPCQHNTLTRMSNIARDLVNFHMLCEGLNVAVNITINFYDMATLRYLVIKEKFE